MNGNGNSIQNSEPKLIRRSSTVRSFMAVSLILAGQARTTEAADH